METFFTYDPLIPSGLLFKMIVDKKIKINLSKIYKLKEAAVAHADLQSRKTTGSVILVP